MSEEVIPRRTAFAVHPFDTSEQDSGFILEKEDGELRKVSPTAKRILDLVDGRRTLGQIRRALEEECGTSIGADEMREIFDIAFARQGLVVLEDYEESAGRDAVRDT